MALNPDILQTPPETYESVRPRIRSGDLLICSGTGFFSKLIQAASKSPWSHVGFVMRMDSIDRVMVLESVEGIGVRTIPLSNYVRDYNGTGKGYPGRIVLARHDSMASETAPLLGPALEALSKTAVDMLGYPYDNKDIGRISARIVLAASHLKEAFKNEIHSEKALICSEYVDLCLHSIGIHIHWNQKGFISPADFAADPAVKALARLAIGTSQPTL